MKSMSGQELQSFLYDQIPLARALGVSVKSANDEAAEVLSPLKPNLNHLGTAFGGSLGAVLILAGYTWLYQAMKSRGFNCHVLLRRSETDYRHPVDSDFSAKAIGPSPEDLKRFLQTYEKKGLARISLVAEIKNAGEPACLFKGEFVAQRADDSIFA